MARCSPLTLTHHQSYAPTHTMEFPPNKYQIAGLDDQARGFNRHAEMQNCAGQFQAVFRYEKFLLEADAQATEEAALTTLVTQLHERGYTQLRTRLLFRGEQYLGNQELWDEHDDPESRNRFHSMIQFVQRWWRGDPC